MLTQRIGRHYQWLHPEVLASNCTVDKKGLHLNNTVQYNTFHTLIIPASKTISVSTLEQALALFQAGGRVIFTSQLPTRAAELGKDARIGELMNELLPAATRYNENKEGGQVYFVAQLTPEALQQALRSPDPYDIAFEASKPLRYLHKEHDGKALFYLVNLDTEAYRGDLLLRGKMRLEAWDPHTGESAPVSVSYEKQGKETVTRLTLDLPEHRSIFLLEQ